MHADHVTAAWRLKQDLGSQIVVGSALRCRGRRPLHCARSDPRLRRRAPFRSATRPGHTAGCITLVLRRQDMAFTGDCLLVRGCGRTDFQGATRVRCTARYTSRSSRSPTRACCIPVTTTAATPYLGRRGARIQSAAGRAPERVRLRRLHAEPRPPASEADRCRRAREPQVRVFGRGRIGTDARPVLGTAGIYLCRILGSARRNGCRSICRPCS